MRLRRLRFVNAIDEAYFNEASVHALGSSEHVAWVAARSWCHGTWHQSVASSAGFLEPLRTGIEICKDKWRSSDRHAAPKPRLGGVAVFIRRHQRLVGTAGPLLQTFIIDTWLIPNAGRIAAISGGYNDLSRQASFVSG